MSSNVVDIHSKKAPPAKRKRRKAEPQPQCSGIKRNGERCPRPARKGHLTCRGHSENPQGAPTKFTAQARKDLIAAFSVGAKPTDAARYAGIHPTTLENWAEKAVQGVPEFLCFFEELEKAHAQHRVGTLTHLTAAAQKGSVRAQKIILDFSGYLPAAVVHEHTHELGSSFSELGGKQPAQLSLAARDKIAQIVADDDDGAGEVVDGEVVE